MRSEGIELLGAGRGSDALGAFARSKSLPAPMSPVFIKLPQEILSGLDRVVLTEAQLHSPLTDGGSPVNVDRLKARFDSFKTEMFKGKDIGQIRIILERRPDIPVIGETNG